MSTLARLRTALVLSVLALPAHSAERDAREWLERMSEALANGNYEGRFFHLRDSRSETLRIIHRVSRGKVTERLVSLDGSGREIIRNETEVIHYMPDRRLVVVEKRTDENSLLSALPIYNSNLESHYSLEKREVGRSGSRKTQLILVQPRDQYRYGYRLWLDYETAMPLKSQLCDRNGNVIEQMLFAELNLRDRIHADLLKPGISAEGYRWVRQEQPMQANVGVTVTWNVIRVPAGFRLTASRTQAIAGSSGPVRHLVYSDGLASVSVFIGPRDTSVEPMHGLGKVGAAFAYSRDLDGHQVVAVGEVPAATVEAMAAGVTKKGKDPVAPAAAAPAR